MLVLTRRVGETIMIGDDIEIEVLEVRPGIVRLGVRAPKSVRVLRSELVAEVASANAEALKETPDMGAIAALKARYAEHRETSRHSLFGVPNPPMEKSALEVSDEERRRVYEAGWASGTLNQMLLAFNDVLISQAANDTAAEFMREKIRSVVRDAQTAETLCPYDFPFGTKRPCLDTDYYETFNREHVRLDFLQTG